ncbi:MAG: glycosyltransferase family 2 protein, partial [Bacteroidota bacterium]|nr:glycosyltransferase family 2 protein [Bacteroidota bacterium]
MIKISAVIISYNEEKYIGRCLESLQQVADEIVVVDSYSQDKTQEICEAHDVTFIEHEFEGYRQQKNWAMAQAENDNILSLDADECLSEELKNSILSVKDNLKADAYSFNRLNNYYGKWIKHSGVYPDRKIRLFDRRKGEWGGV